MQLAVALDKMGDKPRAQQALQAGLGVKRSDGWLADYGSTLRDQALILALLQENNLAANQVDQRLFALSDELAANRWLSTQERNALYLAGRGLLGKPEGQWQARLDSAGEIREFNNAESGMKLEGPC